VTLEEVLHVEPVEYSDKYAPSKYGIIFKEKVFVGPDHTHVAFNVRIKRAGQAIEPPKLFKFMIMDNGKCVLEKEGYNQITVSNFEFRSSHGLPEKSEHEEDEVKHNYVIQAIFDLYEWPTCKTQNEETEDVSWHLKTYSTETLAIIKDTDKEDREKALKASWEQAEPGRAEKARKSRHKWLLQ